MAFDGSARLLWSLAASGTGTAITTSGNSGPYNAASPNARTAVDLRRAEDVWLSVFAGGGSGTAATVQVDAYDDLGNLYLQVLKVTLASAPGQAVASGGMHGGGAGAYVIFPEWGRVSWSLTGSMTGVEIALYAR